MGKVTEIKRTGGGVSWTRPTITMGSPTVMIGNFMAARIGDSFSTSSSSA
jgi:uncharacterized Zn-binding protein involved in type VI secretion